jgi:mannan endo-1,4-beta-mannosidase
MINRRNLVLAGACLAGCGVAYAAGKQPTGRASNFVRVEGARFVLKNRTYRYVGTNLWYGAYLGSFVEGRKRLCRELDMLGALGITNLRVLGAAELSPLHNSIRPATHDAIPPYNEKLLRGLDFLLAEMAKRNLKAVIFLNNFWEWSGGMVTYQYWTNGGHYIDMDDPAHPWPAFADFSAQFYTSPKANALYRAYVGRIIDRRNSISGIRYRDDPAIMSWQLANEPRPGGSQDKTDFSAFYAWIADTARFIKAHDPNHLVSTGNEGTKGCMESTDCVIRANAVPAVDYSTMHIWPLNWGWIDPKNIAGTYDACAANTRRYIATHLEIAKKLNKPAVAEEFGLPRDDGGYALSTSTAFRDRFYGVIFEMVEDSARAGGPFAGSNFWAWGGEGRAQHPDFLMKPGDVSYVGDPPQEPQGRNSVFDCDASTIDVIRRHATALRAISD